MKLALETHKINTYRRYIEELQPRDPSMWQATRRILRKSPTPSPLKANNVLVTSDEEKCEIFANHLERVFTTTIYNDNMETTQHIQNHIAENIPHTSGTIKPVTPIELTKYIQNLPNKKAPGHDRVPNIVLKKFTRKAICYITAIFNACFRISYFPDSWKIAHIILFNKPGKNPKDPTNYRPISLLTAFSKLLERCISTRLNTELNDTNIIPAFQFGFRPKHSTNHQLARITEIIEKGFEAKQHTLIAFIDIAKAFDTVWTLGLIYKIMKINLPDYLVLILKSFLEKRKFQVRINSTISPIKNICAGIPQGSILGPTLYNIFMYDIPQTCVSTIAMYADDTAIITQNENINTAAQQLQSSMDTINDWLKKWNISLNPTKCEAKIFTLRFPAQPPSIIINNQPIPWNPSDQGVKYLGVYLDKRLTWKLHINRKLNECHSRLSQLYPILNRKSPLKHECSLLIYTSLLRSTLTYACTVWGAASNSIIKKVQVFQNKMLRIITNAPWFIRNTQLHNELQIPTIQTFIKKCIKNFNSKLSECPGAMSYDIGSKNIHKRLKRKLPQDLLTTDDEDSD